MAWLAIPAIVLWAVIQSHANRASGHSQRSLGSLRAQRRKADRAGVDFENVPYRPRVQPLSQQEIEDRVNRVGKLCFFAVMAVVLVLFLI